MSNIVGRYMKLIILTIISKFLVSCLFIFNVYDKFLLESYVVP